MRNRPYNTTLHFHGRGAPQDANAVSGGPSPSADSRGPTLVLYPIGDAEWRVGGPSMLAYDYLRIGDGDCAFGLMGSEIAARTTRSMEMGSFNMASICAQEIQIRRIA